MSCASRRLLSGLLAIASGALVASAAAPPPPAPPAEIALYAAASLRDVLLSLQEAAERELGVRLVFNFGASNQLAQQIVAAAEADVFFSADEAWMDHVERAGLVDRASRRSPLSNGLVVVVPREAATRIGSASDLTARAVRRLSLADPRSVPAGKYARAWLEGAGVWPALQDRVVPALDVRAALAAVESGATDAGIVYRTDARISERVRVAHVVPPEEHPRIAYALAAIAGRPRVELARRVVIWLGGPAARAAFEQHGFTVVPGDP
jgi:molybdate transport system substrate-binding protein